MRTIPVDADRVVLIGTGKVSAKAEYGQLSDGSTRPTGNQARDESTGLPLWVIDVLVDDDDARRAEVIGVTVPCADEPTCPKYQPVRFRGVIARIYSDRASGQAKVSLIADAIEGVAVSKSQPAGHAA